MGAGSKTAGKAREGATFGLLGRTLAHSWSPAIHTLFGSAPYDLIELEPDELAGFIRHGRWRGLNVTIPYKRDALALADEATDRARRLGAANTLVRRPDGTILADNTDFAGFAWMLDRFCERELGAPAEEALSGMEALVLGTGGASQAVQAALADAGARIFPISRRGSDTYEGLARRHADAGLIVNTTPVGMYPHCPASPLADGVIGELPRLEGVLDVVYNPCRTGICLQAERAGLPWESGLAMLVAQARFSSELFQGHPIDDALAREVEDGLRKKMANVILIGMPGAGKTTCGRALARLVGRPFVDLDEAFRMDAGVGAAEFIREHGEQAFRERETEVAAGVCRRSGLVIACGGGIVTRPENYPLLHQNGTIVLLERPLDELATSGRPVSEARGVRSLAEERGPLYRAWADLSARCTGSPRGDALEIASMLGLPEREGA